MTERKLEARSSKSLFLLVVSLLSAFAVAQDVEVRSYLDRTQVGLGDQFTLSVEITGSQSNSANPEPPDLRPFAVSLGNGNSSQIQVINGQMSVSRTINYYFQASQEGEFQIPAVRVSTPDGTLSTEPLSIQIDRTSAPARRTRPSQDPQDQVGSDELFVDVTANRKRVYQGQAVVLTYDILTLVSVSSYALVDLPSTQGFWVEEYPIDQPQTRNEIVNGRRYTAATIKQMALLPTAPGSKVIDPLVVECEVRVRRRRGDLLDDFFSDPFRRDTQKRRIASLPVEIEVLPLPGQGRPAGFSGAVGRFSIDASADQTDVEANQAITLRLRVQGEGNITSVKVPEFTLPSSFEVYPPETKTSTSRRSNGIAGERSFEYVVVPRAAGNFQIPPVDLAYFDPDLEQYRTVRTEPIDLEIRPSSDLSFTANPTISKREVELLNEDIRFLKSDTTLRRQSDALIHPWTLALGLLLPVLLVGGSLLVQKHRSRLASDQGYARLRRSRKLARARLTSARKMLEGEDQSKFYAEIDRALTGFIADRLNLAEAGLLSSQLRSLLSERGFQQDVVERYLDCIRICQQKRFAPVADSPSERKESLDRAESVVAELEQCFERAGHVTK